MKYLLMVLGKQSDYDGMRGDTSTGGIAWSESDIKTMYEHMEAINNDLAESGELVDAQGLTEPAQAKLVTLRDGVPVVTDGPYGETKEEVAGYWLVDCESIERATQIAARAAECPQPAGAPNYPVVVRQVEGQ
jgi:hypothetical protein